MCRIKTINFFVTVFPLPNQPPSSSLLHGLQCVSVICKLLCRGSQNGSQSLHGMNCRGISNYVQFAEWHTDAPPRLASSAFHDFIQILKLGLVLIFSQSALFDKYLSLEL